MTDTSKATIAAVVERLQDHLTLKWMSPPSKITGEECQMVTVEALEQTLSLISALEAERDALRAQVEFTMSDHQRLLRKEDVEGTCTSIAVCFDGGRGVRCGPCAIKQAAAAKVETDLTIPNSPEVSRLNRTLATLQAKLEKAAEALEPFAKGGAAVTHAFGEALFPESSMAFPSGCTWSENGAQCVVTWGDFRRARSTLSTLREATE